MIAERSTVDSPNSLFTPQRMIALVVLEELGHLASVLLGHSPLLLSNIFQLTLALTTVAVCLRGMRFSTTWLGRRSWRYISGGFGIWSLAQALYLYEMFHPAIYIAGVHIDDVLWLLVGLPLLLAVNPQLDDRDEVRWLDRVQILVFFGALHLLVFATSSGLNTARAYAIQNVVLVICCIVRLPLCTDRQERRFFARLAAFLSSYAALGAFGDWIISRGWPTGGIIDLVWTMPFALFSVLILRDELWDETRKERSSRLLRAMGSLHNLTIAILPVLSMGATAWLTRHHLILGGALLAVSFFTFFSRISKRERAWQRAHRSLEQAVLQDSLTGLGNRVLLRQELKKSLQIPDGAPVSLIFADLDRFKSVNDTLGHELGDLLLIEIAHRLRAAAPATSVVCRLGGDEFVILTRAPDVYTAEAYGAELLEAIRVPIAIGKSVIHCTASVGVVLASPNESADDILRTADHAMYRAKQLGRDRVQVFDQCFLKEISARWQLEADLRQAVEQHEIYLDYQPIVSLLTGEICGLEALARWHHPTHGQVPPPDFISLAEQSGLIIQLGAQLLERACRQVAEWNEAWHSSFSVSVNFSPRQLSDPHVVSMVLDTLERTKLPARLLKIEITESALFVNEATARQVLSEIHRGGIQLSLDDFGTGYSSLSFLLSLPVHEIKIDRSFVSNLFEDKDRSEVVRTVIQLGRSLGKQIVAEGAETEGDLQGLLSMGCERVQGYIFSKPQSPAWLADHLWSLNDRVSARMYLLGGSPHVPSCGAQLQVPQRANQQLV